MAGGSGVAFTIGAVLGSSVAAAFTTVEAKLEKTRKTLADAQKQAATFNKAMELQGKRDSLAAKVRDSGGQDKKALAELTKISAQYRVAKANALAYGGSVKTWAAQHAAAAKSIEAANRQLARHSLLQRESAHRAELMGKAVALAGTTMVAAAPVRSAINFESAMADAAKTIDGMRDETGKLTPAYYDLEASVKALGRTLPLTHEELASLFAAGGQQGMTDVKDLTEFAQMATHMSVAFGMSTDEAADSIGGFRSALKMTMPQTRAVLDLMNQFANTTSASEKGIADIVRRMGPLGAIGGVAAKPLTALAATLDAMKIAPEVAATGLKNMTLALTAGSAATKKQKEAFGKLGIDTVKLSKAMQTDAEGAILSVLGALQKLPKDQQLSTMMQIFGKESLGAIAPLLGSLDKVTANLKLAGDESKYAGAMQQEFANRAQTTANNLTLFKNRLNESAISIGSAVLPALNDLLGTVGPLISSFASWATTNQGTVKTILAIGAGLIGLRAAFLATQAAVSIVRSTVAATAFVFHSWGAVTKTVAAGQWLLNAALTANPIGLVVAGVAALGAGLVALYNYCEPVRTAFDALFGGLKKYIDMAVGGFRAVASGFGKVASFLGFGGDDEPEQAQAAAAAAQQTAPPALDALAAAAAPAAGGAGAGSVSVGLSFNINGMPAQEFAQGVMQAINSNKDRLERVIQDIVNDQLRVAYAKG